jgi:iron complex transport system ATP-binding protein
MSLLTLDRLTVRRCDCPVVDGVSMTVEPGQFIGLIGPNGAGKTTLLRGALGLLPSTGMSSLIAMSGAARAKAVAWLPQEREIAWPVSVAAVVALGRVPHGGGGLRHEAVGRALTAMGLTGFRDRIATELSGGEQARVLIARALAQGAPLILADEPIAGLDPAAQIAAMQVFAGHAAAGGAVVAALHDLGLAARHCTHLAVMSRGRLVAFGAPADVLTDGLMADVFGIKAHLDQTEQGLVFQATGLTEAEA